MEEKTENENPTVRPPWSGEDWQRDLERRKMLVVRGSMTWNMLFFVFFLLPLVKIYHIGNPHWLALANVLLSVCIGFLFWKKQKLPEQTNTEHDEDEKMEETA